MRKENNIKFPDKIKKENVVLVSFETAEEALEEARKQAEQSTVSPASVIVTYRDGYVNALGEVFGANGVAAETKTNTGPKPIESPVVEESSEELRIPEPAYKTVPEESVVLDEVENDNFTDHMKKVDPGFGTEPLPPVEDSVEPDEPVAEDQEEEPEEETWPPTLEVKEEEADE